MTIKLIQYIHNNCRFDNPFRSVVPPAQIEDSTPVSVSVSGGMKRRDSQISDSTLPDSEHTDRPQSSSLQSSGLQSDEEESVTTTGRFMQSSS